jgi:YVTN family beta-propeller protein
MTLFPINSGQARARLVEAGAVFAAVALIAGCGSNYRPVVTPINPNGPPAQPNSLAVVISSPAPTQPGIATIIDYSGDDIMAQQPIGVGPVAFAVDQAGQTGYTVNSDTTVTSFPVSTSLQAKLVQNSTLNPTTRITGLYAPASGIWASDLDQNVVDILAGAPPTFNLAIPVAPTPVIIVGPSKTSQRNYAISQNNVSTPVGSIIPYDTTCNTPALFPGIVANQQTGEADALEVTSHTVSARIPVGACPVYAIENTDGDRLFVLNRADDTITVINSQANTLDSCVCPSTGCVNQNGRSYFCHPTLPLSLHAVSNTGITPPNGTTGMPAVAGPVYAEFNVATDQLIVADYDGGAITVIDVSLDQFQNDSPTFGTTFTIPVGNNPASVTVLPDGSRAYTANQTDSTVTIANLTSHTVLKTLQVNGHPRTVVSTANSLYGKVYVASPDSPLLSIIRTDLDIPDTTVLVTGNIVDVRVSTQDGTSGNSNNTARRPGAGQPCYLPPGLEPPPTGSQTAMQVCQTMP